MNASSSIAPTVSMGRLDHFAHELAQLGGAAVAQPALGEQREQDVFARARAGSPSRPTRRSTSETAVARLSRATSSSVSHSAERCSSDEKR
jgi:hypothetical protein